MSVIKVAKLQHPKASGPALTLAPDGTVFIAAGTISFNTDQIQEGNTNLYFTESRVDARTAANRAPLQFTENLRDTNYTLALTDAARVVAFDSTQPTTLTIPANSSVPFPIGTVINVYRAGTGSVTIEPAGAAVIRNPESKNTYDIAERYAEVSLRKRGTDEWVLSGNVEYGSSGGGEGSSVGEFDGTYTLSTPLIFLGNNSNESAFSLTSYPDSYGSWDLYLAPAQRATDGWDAQMDHPHVEALAQQVWVGSYLTFEVGMNPEETYEFVAHVYEGQFNYPNTVHVYISFDGEDPYASIPHFQEQVEPNLMVYSITLHEQNPRG